MREQNGHCQVASHFDCSKKMGSFLFGLITLIVSMVSQLSPVYAFHWETSYQGNVQKCSSGASCAIWQSTQAYGASATFDCKQLYTNAGGIGTYSCVGQPAGGGAIRPGLADPVCDVGEVAVPTGCVPQPLGKTPPTCASEAADPVQIMEGGLRENITDYSVGTVHPLTFTRYYWSDRSTGSAVSQLSRLGGTWRSNFDVKLFVMGSASSPSGATITTFDGRELIFQGPWDAPNPTWRLYGRDVNRNLGLVPGTPPQTLTYTNNVWTLTDENAIQYAFDSTGQLQTITYRDGYKQSLTWSNGVNTQVSDNLGRSISFQYDASSSTMTSLVTSDGQTFNYTYTNLFPTQNVDQSVAVTYSDASATSTYALQSVTYPGSTKPKISYEYGDSRFPWSLTGVVDQRGVRVSIWTYAADGRVASNSMAGSVGTYTFAYDTANHQTTVTNPLGKQAIYAYADKQSPYHVLTQIQGQPSTNCAAANTSYTYDSNNYLSQVTDGEGRVTAYANDGAGHPTSITYGYGTSQAATTTMSWNASLNVPTQIVQPNLQTDLTWNAAGQLAQVTQTDKTSQTVPFSTNGRTRTWTYAYGTGGLLTSVDGPLSGTGDTVAYAYNSTGFLQKVTDEVGHITTVTAWNGRGQPTSVTGMNSVVSTYSYDDLGRLTGIIGNPGSSQTAWSMTYTAAGDLATLTEPAGAVLSMTWDDARRLTAITNNLGETISFTRDAMGNATGKTIKAADGSTVVYQMTNTFDELGRLIKKVGGASRTWQFAYDRTDLLTTTTDPRNKSLGYGYDAVSRLISETERDSGTVAHAYNGKSEEVTFTDPRSLATTYVRNGFGDVIQETSPDRGTTVYDYDARGLVISRKDARAVQTTYGYDNAGRLTTVSYPAATALNVTYTYDGAAAGNAGKGHVTHVVDAGGSTDFTYDAMGRVSGESRTFGSKTYKVTYTYDTAGSGRLSFETLPSGHALRFGYDALGRVNAIAYGTSVSGPFTAIASGMTYFPFGELSGIGFANGLTMSKTDDKEYFINGLFLAPTSGNALITRYHTFGDGLNLTKLNNDAIDPSTSQTFTYDDAQRLLSGSGAYGSRSYTYDQVGNRLTEGKTVSGTTTSTSYAYPTNSNTLTSVKQGTTTSRAFTYDAAGNTTQDIRGSTAYNYTINNAGRISQLKIGSTVTANYTYDAKDRLSVRQTLNMTPAGTTQYIYDVWDHLIAETNGSGTVVRQYVWAGDVPVAVLDGSSNAASPTVLYVHADHLNRPEMMTNGSGTVVWKAVYEPFGTVSSITGSASSNGRFPGQWFQVEAGLAYNWHRHYDSTIGRYASPDPIGLRGGSNLFGYVGQSPIIKTDQRGLDSPTQGAYGCWITGTQGCSSGVQVCANLPGEAPGPGPGDPPEDPPPPLKPLPGVQQPYPKDGPVVVQPPPAGPVSPYIDPRDVAGKTPAEIDALAKGAGLIEKGPDPMGGKGSYIDPVTGAQRVLIHPTDTGGPTAHVNDPTGQRLDIDGNPTPSRSLGAHLPLKLP